MKLYTRSEVHTHLSDSGNEQQVSRSLEPGRTERFLVRKGEMVVMATEHTNASGSKLYSINLRERG